MITIMFKSGVHKGYSWVSMVDAIETSRYLINDIDVHVICWTYDDKWWIIARFEPDDAHFTDVGPFDDADMAMIHLCLLSDSK